MQRGVGEEGAVHKRAHDERGNNERGARVRGLANENRPAGNERVLRARNYPGPTNRGIERGEEDARLVGVGGGKRNRGLKRLCVGGGGRRACKVFVSGNTVLIRWNRGLEYDSCRVRSMKFSLRDIL